MKIKVKDAWICCTDGESIFHIIENREGSFTETEQPKIITAKTEEKLMRKIYKKPKKSKVHWKDLEPKSKKDLDKVCVLNQSQD